LWGHNGHPARHGRVERYTKQLPNILGVRCDACKRKRAGFRREPLAAPIIVSVRSTRQPRTVYVQQTQVPGGWQDHAETDDRAIGMGRYKLFAREKGTRLIERTERVLVEGLAQNARK